MGVPDRVRIMYSSPCHWVLLASSDEHCRFLYSKIICIALAQRRRNYWYNFTFNILNLVSLLNCLICYVQQGWLVYYQGFGTDIPQNEYKRGTKAFCYKAPQMQTSYH